MKIAEVGSKNIGYAHRKHQESVSTNFIDKLGYEFIEITVVFLTTLLQRFYKIFMYFFKPCNLSWYSF